MKVLLSCRGRDGICRERFADYRETDGAPVDPLKASVGENGVNHPADVTTIQDLLNSIPASEGGPFPLLAEDSKCGPLTKAAILKFQKKHDGLLKDGRIDPNRNTWKRLLAVSGRDQLVGARPSVAGAAAPAPAQIPDATQLEFTAYLYYTRHRIFEAIKMLDKARSEADVLNIRSFMLPKATFMQAYANQVNTNAVEVAELITANRCFKFLDKTQDALDMQMTHGQVSATLGKLRQVYTTMFDVILRNSISVMAVHM